MLDGVFRIRHRPALNYPFAGRTRRAAAAGMAYHLEESACFPVTADSALGIVRRPRRPPRQSSVTMRLPSAQTQRPPVLTMVVAGRDLETYPGKARALE